METAAKSEPCVSHICFWRQGQQNKSDFLDSTPGHYHIWACVKEVSNVFHRDLSLNGHVAFPKFSSLKWDRHSHSRCA